MAGKYRIKRCLCIFTALLTAAMMLMPTALAFDESENQAQHSQLEQDNKKMQDELRSTNMSIAEKEAYSKKLQKQISEYSKKIQQSNSKIKELNKQINEKQALIDDKLLQIKDRLDILRKRLRSIYTAGDISSLEIILQAKDFNDYVDKMELVQSISEYDNKLIKELQDKMAVISNDQQKLKDAKSKIETEKQQLESSKKKINELSKYNQKLIEDLKKQKNEKEDSIKENQQRQRELENALAHYNAEKAARMKAERIAQQAANKAKNNRTNSNKTNNSNNNSNKNSNKNSDNNSNNKTNNNNSANNSDVSNENNDNNITDINNNGNENNDNNITDINNNGNDNTENDTNIDSFVWPCPGHTYLTSSFEEWRGASNHGALDIADGNVYGAEVVACWYGTVMYTCDTCQHDYGKSSSCGCGGGYGNFVMIDHGGGKVSIYGHLSEVVATPGEEVTPGQLIGYVGSTGYSTGPHLHFEMQQDGVRYDPMTEY